MFRLIYLYNNLPYVKDYNDIKDIGKFLLGYSFNEELANGVMNWCSNASFGQSLEFYDNGCAIYCYNETKDDIEKLCPDILAPIKRQTVKNIAERIKFAIMYHRSFSGFKEFHQTILTYGIWKVDFEIHPYGNARFWVSYEYKSGEYNASILTIYNYEGNIKCTADFEVSKQVIDKMKKVYKYLNDIGYAQYIL